MEQHLLKPASIHLSSLTIKSSKRIPLRRTNHSPSSLPNIQLHKLSTKELSKILRTDAAIEAIEKKANSSKYNNLSSKLVLEALNQAIKLNHWESSLKIFNLLRKQNWYQPRYQTYIKLLVMLGKCKQPNQASWIVETMRSDGLQPTVEIYTALLSAYALNGFFNEAFRILNTMKYIPDCKPTAFTYSTLIQQFIKLHHFDMIGLIREDMVNSGIEFNTVIYNILIDGYGKANCFELMENSLTEMIQSGKCHPDTFTFNSVIGSFGECGRIEEMEKWFDEFQIMGLSPDIMTFNILIKSYGKSGLYRKVELVMEFMTKRFYSPTIVTYNIIIDVFGKVGDLEKMDSFFLKMKHTGLKPNSITYSSLVSAYSKAGVLGKVDGILRQVANSDVILDTLFFNCAISAYGNAGDVERMMDLFMVMERRGCKPDNITLSTMLKKIRAQGMIGICQNLEKYLADTRNTSSLSVYKPSDTKLIG